MNEIIDQLKSRERLIQKLSENFISPDEDQYEDFVFHVESYIDLVRNMETTDPKAAEARERIKKVEKAFARLTDEDKAFLDRVSELDRSMADYPYQDDDSAVNVILATLQRVSHDGCFPLCELMQKALEHQVPAMRKSGSRAYLVKFAMEAVRREWVDISVNRTELVELLNLMMLEAGVNHEANDVAGEAVTAVETERHL